MTSQIITDRKKNETWNQIEKKKNGPTITEVPLIPFDEVLIDGCESQEVPYEANLLAPGNTEPLDSPGGDVFQGMSDADFEKIENSVKKVRLFFPGLHFLTFYCIQTRDDPDTQAAIEQGLDCLEKDELVAQGFIKKQVLLLLCFINLSRNEFRLRSVKWTQHRLLPHH